MPERIRKILDRIIEWWKKFNTKQRALLISITSVIVVALVILAYVVSRPNYVALTTCETAKEAAQVKSLLEGDSIEYQQSDDGLSFKVKEQDRANATILLGSNDIAASNYSIENVTSGGFSTTESDKQKLYQDYLQKEFEEDLEAMDNIEEASVTITLPNNDGTILSKDEQGTAAVTLKLKDPIDSDVAYGIAKFVATELGNDDTSGITILDTKMNVLYSGADADSSIGIVSSQLNYQQKQENMIKSEIKEALLNSNLYSTVDIAMNLKVDYDTTETATHEYYAPDGQTNGMLSSASEYSSESYGGSAATPGTDSNDDTTYVTEDGATTYSKINQTDYKYQNNETIINKKSAGGSIDYENSSVSVVLTKYIVYDEQTLDDSGELEDMTFDQFKAAHSESSYVEVPEDLVTMIAKATGFSNDAISVTCIEQPQFVEKTSSGRTLSDILQIVLAVLIFAMLGYVVFRSTRKAKDADMEPELSVEGLLESTASDEENLEDIGYSEKSETRILIEKFVDDNPEAAALLLRNWLNDEWG